jgi:Zn-dependent M28 family amino/carboxypeptidase
VAAPGSLAELVATLAAGSDASRLRRDVEVLAVGPRNRRWAPAAMAAAEDHAAAELALAGWRVQRQSFRSPLRFASNDRGGLASRLLRVRPYGGLGGVNLLARHPTAPPGPVVLVGAHLDTVRHSPGADDNASGVAVVLEVARLLAGTAAAVALAVFDLEELGLVGASTMARQLSADGSVLGMIGLESVGYYGPAPQRLPLGAAQAFPRAARAIADGGGRGDFTLVVHRRTSTGPAWFWEAAAALMDHRTVLLRDPRRDGLAGTLSTIALPHTLHLGRSDHAAFWRRGVSSLMITDTASFRNPGYHRDGDVAETLDYERLRAVAVATAATALTWASGASA